MARSLHSSLGFDATPAEKHNRNIDWDPTWSNDKRTQTELENERLIEIKGYEAEIEINQPRSIGLWQLIETWYQMSIADGVNVQLLLKERVQLCKEQAG